MLTSVVVIFYFCEAHRKLQEKMKPLIVIFSLILFAVIHKTTAIYCYQCNSNEDTYCSEAFNTNGLTLEPAICEGIHEARYCIKATGMYAGTIGTRRFCSSRHHGNECEYIRRPGDEREYRSCVYTCSSDGCNGAGNVSESRILFIISLSCSILLWCLLKW